MGGGYLVGREDLRRSGLMGGRLQGWRTMDQALVVGISIDEYDGMLRS